MSDRPIHERMEELFAADSVGGLDEDGRRELGEAMMWHDRRCPQCAAFRVAYAEVAASLAMSLETSASRMHRMGRSELVEGEIPTLDEVVARISAVDTTDVERVVERVLRGTESTLAVVGPHDEAEFAGYRAV